MNTTASLNFQLFGFPVRVHYSFFFIALLPSYPIYAFLYGFAGGWDDATLDEFHQATHLANFMRPLAWFFWFSSSLGAKISPLHNVFPIKVRAEALVEAATLTEERVQLT